MIFYQQNIEILHSKPTALDKWKNACAFVKNIKDT